MKREKSGSSDILYPDGEKRREAWGATCIYSRGNRRMPEGPMPLAPHLAREWSSWGDSDDESEEEREEKTLQSLHRYHRQICPTKRPTTGGLTRKKRSTTPSSPLLIRSLSACSTPNTRRSTFKHNSPGFDLLNSPVAKHGFRTIFSAKRANKSGHYQWVQSNDRDFYSNRTENQDRSRISCLRVGSTPALTPQRPPTAPFPQKRTAHPDTGHSRPTTLQFPCNTRLKSSSSHSDHLNLRPAGSTSPPATVDFHRPLSSHMTGRAGLKPTGYFELPAAESTGPKHIEMLRICVKTEAIRCSSTPPREQQNKQVPEPPAPSPLVPH